MLDDLDQILVDHIARFSKNDLLRGKFFITKNGSYYETVVIDSSALLSDKSISNVGLKQLVTETTDFLYDFILYIYGNTIKNYLEEFELYRISPESYEKINHGKFTYPLFEILVRDPEIGGPKAIRSRFGRTSPARQYGYVTSAGTYISPL